MTGAVSAIIAAALLVVGTAPAQADICIPGIYCPSPSPSPSPTPTHTPTSTSTGGAPHPTSAPGRTSRTPSQPTSAASPPAGPTPSSEIAARFQNAAFLDDLLKILAHPTADQQPDLKHFRVAAQLDSSDSAGGTTPNSTQLSAAEVLLFVLIWAVAVGVALSLGLRRRIRFARLRDAAVLALIPVVAFVSGSLRTTAPAPQLAASRLAQPVSARAFGPGMATTTTVDQLDPLQRALKTASPAWSRLLSIESLVALQQQRLSDQESRIRDLASDAARPDATPSALPTPSPPATEVDIAMSHLLAQHDATNKAYRQALQEEYELYRQAAQDPAFRDQLLASVLSQPQSDALEAINYDLQVLQTQLTQETAINAAASKLAAAGSLGAAQLSAMRHHQPFITPIEAPMSQGFGPSDFSLEPPLSYNGAFYPHFHTGLDLTGPLDAPLHAAADGVVVLATATQDNAGHLTGYGNYVVIAHPDGFFTLYGHMNSVAVKEGQVVHQGEIIGQEGSTGLSTGPHVHFEIRHNGQFLDPTPYLAGQIPA